MTDYLTLTDVLAMHAALIERYGGAQGVRDMGALEAALFRPQSGYYKDVVEEAAALLESLAINHPFIDGNKRVAFAACDVFLRINGFKLVDKSDVIYALFMELFNAQRFRKDELEEWLRRMTVGMTP